MTGKVDRLRAAPRCGARTRAGTPCRSPRVKDRPRCRMHGGARGSGGQKGNRNALRHGFYSAPAKYRRRVLRKIGRDMRQTLEILAAAPLIGTATALRLAARVDNDPGLAVPEEYDWRALWRDVYGDADPADDAPPAACPRSTDAAGCMGSMDENDTAGPGQGAAVISRALDEGRQAQDDGMVERVGEEEAMHAPSPIQQSRHPELVEGRRAHDDTGREDLLLPSMGPMDQNDAPPPPPASPGRIRYFDGTEETVGRGSWPTGERPRPLRPGRSAPPVDTVWEDEDDWFMTKGENPACVWDSRIHGIRWDDP